MACWQHAADAGRALGAAEERHLGRVRRQHAIERAEDRPEPLLESVAEGAAHVGECVDRRDGRDGGVVGGGAQWTVEELGMRRVRLRVHHLLPQAIEKLHGLACACGKPLIALQELEDLGESDIHVQFAVNVNAHSHLGREREETNVSAARPGTGRSGGGREHVRKAKRSRWWANGARAGRRGGGEAHPN